MADTKKTNKVELDFASNWAYAPAPEDTKHIKLEKQYDLFIDGKFVKPNSKKYFDTINPATEQKIAEVALCPLPSISFLNSSESISG